MKNIKKGIIGLALISALGLTGCSMTDGLMGDTKENKEVVEAKPFEELESMSELPETFDYLQDLPTDPAVVSIRNNDVRIEFPGSDLEAIQSWVEAKGEEGFRVQAEEPALGPDGEVLFYFANLSNEFSFIIINYITKGAEDTIIEIRAASLLPNVHDVETPDIVEEVELK